MSARRSATNTFQLTVEDRETSLLHAAVTYHEDALVENRLALRNRLQSEREVRESLRRDKQLNEYVVRKIENHKTSSTTILTSGASDAFSWRNIEDRRDLDTRLRRYRQTEQCEVVDVVAWANSARDPAPPMQVTDLSSPRGRQSPLTARRGSISPTVVITSSGGSKQGGGSQRRNAAKHHRSMVEEAPLSVKALASSLKQPASRSPNGRRASYASGKTGTTGKGESTVLSAPSQPPGDRSPSAGGGGASTARRTSASQSPRLPQLGKQRNAAANSKRLFGNSTAAERKRGGATGLRAQIASMLLPTLTVGSGINQRAIAQCELDFTSLSYGKTHIPLEIFTDAGTEKVVDYGHRRVLFVEFVDYMHQNNLTYLPFVSFVHIVHPRWPRSGIPQAAALYAPNIGWAVGLSFELAESVNHIWRAARREINDEGKETISFDEFARLCQADGSSSLEFNEVKALFYATDSDGNGTLDKAEFAQFVAGRVDYSDVCIDEQAAEGEEGNADGSGGTATVEKRTEAESSDQSPSPDQSPRDAFAM
jgi:hypothetical protein